MAVDERARHCSMIRGFHLADFLTLANAACRMGGVLCAIIYGATHAIGYFSLGATATHSPGLRHV